MMISRDCSAMLFYLNWNVIWLQHYINIWDSHTGEWEIALLRPRSIVEKKSLFLLEKMPSQMEVEPCYELLTLLILFSLITLLTFFCLRFYFRSVQQTRMVDPFRVAAQQQNVSIISCSTSYEYARWPASRVSTTLIKRVVAAARGARGGAAKPAAARNACWAAERILERVIPAGPRRRGRQQRFSVPGWCDARREPGWRCHGFCRASPCSYIVDHTGSQQVHLGRCRLVSPTRF